VTYARLVFRVHAVERMAERGIGASDVRQVLDSGEVIADYPGDLPYPSRLVLAWLGARPVHVVAADNHDDRITIVITVYEPDSALWETDFRTRRKP
jgi:hypothetical protein